MITNKSEFDDAEARLRSHIRLFDFAFDRCIIAPHFHGVCFSWLSCVTY